MANNLEVVCRGRQIAGRSTESGADYVSTPAENDLPLGAPHQVKLRVNIFWSLSGTAVYSVSAGQTPAETISRAAKKLSELGAATEFVFNRASARDGYLTITMQRSRLRTEAPSSLSSDALNYRGSLFQ
jgi:hypothetical protein